MLLYRMGGWSSVPKEGDGWVTERRIEGGKRIELSTRGCRIRVQLQSDSQCVLIVAETMSADLPMQETKDIVEENKKRK